MSGFDYIIVGAGSAGCVLAERLSADPSIRVLLLEAGAKDSHPLFHMPKGIGRLNRDSRYFWTYATEAENGGRPEQWRRGKVLGGSSSVNGMMYFRGHPQDYEDWESNGAPGWGWRDMRRAFEAIESDPCGGGTDGAIGVSKSKGRSPLIAALIRAGTEMGVPPVTNPNHPDQEGVSLATWSISHGRRSSSTRFLKRASNRPNLKIETRVEVDRVLFEGRRAIGVFTAGPDGHEIRTAGEVILCAGALASPLILQRSGVGDGDRLRGMGIPLVQHSPFVGRHMLEHRLLKMEYETKGPLTDNRQFRPPLMYWNGLRYALTRSGPLAGGAYDVSAFVRTRPELDRPDAEILMATYSFDVEAGRVEISRNHRFHLFGYPLRSRSEGFIHIRGADPAAAPRIMPNYLSDPYDREVTIGMFRYIRRWMTRPAIAPLLSSEVRPGASVESDEEILQAFHRQGAPGFHACSTARMGLDDASPVDPRLRVKGVEGLRVADGSVLPAMVSANTNATIMAIGWRAAELIAEDRRAARD